MKIPSLLAILAIAMAQFSFSAESPGSSVSLETSEGKTIKGTLGEVSEGVARVTTEGGVVKIPLEKLTAESRNRIQKVEAENISFLKTRVTELEALVDKLRNENAALRRETPPVASGPQRLVEKKEPAEKMMPADGDGAGTLWISKTGKRHNSRCRYFQTSAGHKGGANEGVACKICGG